ncbi:hypothetical protein J6590_092296, partial [Homalodisca vitripennis]
MQHIRYEKKLGQLEYQIQYKETLSDFHEFIVLDLYPARNRNRGRPVSLKNVEQILLTFHDLYYPFTIHFSMGLTVVWLQIIALLHLAMKTQQRLKRKSLL